MHFDKFIIAVSLNFLLYSSGIRAAPSGADLETACRQSLDHGFHGTAGMLCTWYVTPCDCDNGGKQEIPRVCLPATVTVETLAEDVIAGLRAQPELRTKTAAYAAARILAHIYPCTDQTNTGV